MYTFRCSEFACAASMRSTNRSIRIICASRAGGAPTPTRTAQVREGLAVRQFIERFVGQCPASGGQIGQDGCHGLLLQPAHGSDRVFGGGDVVAERLQSGMRRFRG